MALPGVTLDTGFLIALERRELRAWARRKAWAERGIHVTIPTAVLVEWWRGTGQLARLREGASLEPLPESVALEAGKALGTVGKGPSVVDAVVMASAALRGDVVYTSDVEDLQALRSYFPSVRVVGLSS